MGRPERSFALGTLAATALVPGLLLLARPFGAPGADLGVLAGWGLALLTVVPSFLLLARVMTERNQLRFQRVFMGATMGRFGLALLGVLGFALLVPEPHLVSFVLTFFLGYAILSALELTLLLRKAPERSGT